MDSMAAELQKLADPQPHSGRSFAAKLPIKVWSGGGAQPHDPRLQTLPQQPEGKCGSEAERRTKPARDQTTPQNRTAAEEQNRTLAAPQDKSRTQGPQAERQRNQEQRRRSCYHYRCPRNQNHEESWEEQTRTAEVEHVRKTHPEAAELCEGPGKKLQPR